MQKKFVTRDNNTGGFRSEWGCSVVERLRAEEGFGEVFDMCGEFFAVDACTCGLDGLRRQLGACHQQVLGNAQPVPRACHWGVDKVRTLRRTTRVTTVSGLMKYVLLDQDHSRDLDEGLARAFLG